MAHFAELDLNNKVLRVVVACNQNIANNGGEQSEQAAEHFKTIAPFSSNGVKWVQTSYNRNFRKQFAGIGYTYNVEKNIFVVLMYIFAVINGNAYIKNY
jgi:phage shock protein PspC (stress-responsive transcriptional regulator)